jgi:type I restriction enzyme, S subunit
LLPPLPEQKKIAKILTSVDEVIETTETQINKLKDLKKGMMNELLTKGIGHTEFKDSPVGRIPVGWEVIKLSSIVKSDRAITYGIVQTGMHIENGTPCVRVVDLMKHNMAISGMVRTTLKISNQYKRTILEQGDIMFALRGEIGRVRIVDNHLVDANLTRGIALISPSKHYNSKYLLWALRSNNVRKNILDAVNGSALQEIPLGNLRNIEVPIPKMEEQQKIASILNSIDTNIEFKQTKLTQTKNLKKSLMSDLLTGRVRIKV